MAVAVAPEIESMALLRILDPEKYTAMKTAPEGPPPQLCQETIFWLDINIDGISLFKAGKFDQVCIGSSNPCYDSDCHLLVVIILINY